MSVDCAQKKVWLAEAELALHRLQTGSAEQVIQFGSGKSVTYTSASISKLQAYVADLQRQCDECDGTAGNTPRRGPIRFTF